MGNVLVANAQDLLCNVQVNSQNVQMSNRQIFEDMENAINQFMNQRKWVDEKVLQSEKINCSFVLNITSAQIDRFDATVSITSNRPVYGTSYTTPMLNHLDQEWTFSYAQSQTLEYQENAIVNDLTALLGFYANIIIGLDYDAMAKEGGTPYFTKALQIRNNATNLPGWAPNDGKGNKNRYYLIDNILDDRFRSMRTANYLYHFGGLDIMRKEMEEGRKSVFAALEQIQKTQQVVPNGMLLKVFFNTKRDELINIFKKADAGTKNKVVELLGRLDPANANTYENIKKG